MKVPLQKWKVPEMWSADVLHLSSSLPFVQSRSGFYVHRPRSISIILSGGTYCHTTVSCWCGMSLTIGSKRKRERWISDLVEEPSSGRPVCATCEGRAIGSGQLGSREIAGRDVIYSCRPIMGRLAGQISAPEKSS